MLIGLCGPAGAGKNTVADILACEGSGEFVLLAFADPIYQCISAITGLPASRLKDRTVKEQVISWLGRSPRQLLQSMGTDWGRDQVHPEIWIRITMERASRHMSLGHRVVVTDVRFDNEAEAIVAAGGEVWRVIRPGWRCLDVEAANHRSEAGVSDRLVSRTVENSGTLDDLKRSVAAAKI